MREANQKLVLAGLREQELVEDARAGALVLRALLDQERVLQRVSLLFADSRDHRKALSEVVRLAAGSVADAVVIELSADDVQAPAKFSAGAVGKAADTLLARVRRSGETAVRGSSLCVPIRVRGAQLGTLFASLPRSPQAVDLALFEQIAERAGLAVDNGRLLEQTQAAIRLRDELLAVITHDFASPLGAVRFSAEAILLGRDRPSSTEVVVAAAETIRLAQAQMSSMVAELVDVAQVHLGRMVLRKDWHDLGSIVEHVVRLLEGAARAREVRLQRRGRTRPVYCDRERMIRLLSNLLHNAIKFTRRGTAVTVGIAGGPAEVRLSVSDHGPGIPKSQRERLFKPWATVRPAPGQGTGLGLYIARGIARAHGGDLWLVRGDRRGSELRVSLPVAGKARERHRRVANRRARRE